MSMTPADAATFTRIIQKLTYYTIAASQAAQVLGSGNVGDLIGNLIIVPATTSPGVVTLTDGSTAINVFAGGASSVADLKPFAVPINAQSKNGAWKVTTGANVSVVATGVFT